MCNNVPVEEAIEITPKELYSSHRLCNPEVPETPRSATKSILRLAITSVHISFNKLWYTQSDGLAIDVSLAVMLANLWMKSFELFLGKSIEGRENKTDMKGMCIDCNRRIFSREKESSANCTKTGFTQKVKVSLTRSLKTCRICSFYAENVQQRKRRN